MKKNPTVLLLATSAIALITLSISPFIGMHNLSLDQIVSDPFQSEIFWTLRVPRVLIAFLAGAGLALCGMVFQSIFRNPLADPFTLGVASGASCGAAFSILFGFSGVFLGISGISIGAFAGSILSMSIVFGLSVAKKNATSLTMLLSGIIVSFLFSSILMSFQYVSSIRDSFQIVRWLMGGIEVYGYDQIKSILPLELAALLLIALKLPDLDHLLTGDDIAKSRGVNIIFVKIYLITIATVLVGGIVSVCGPIGFVGLVIPHVCRFFFGNRNLILGIGSFLIGGIFLVLCDILARVVIAPAEIPVGVITSLIGGPFFLYILFTNKNTVEL
jgi:iron complex transport system permease protein